MIVTMNDITSSIHRENDRFDKNKRGVAGVFTMHFFTGSGMLIDCREVKKFG